MAFRFYTPFTIRSGQVPSPQTGFSAILNPTDERFKDVAHAGKVESSSGYDLRPYADSSLTTPLGYALTYYSGTTGTLEMRVNITASDGLTIYLAYGDPSLVTDGSSGGFNAN